MKMQIILQIPTESILSIARVLTADATGTSYDEKDGAARDRILRAIIGQAYYPKEFRPPELGAYIETERRQFARALRSRRMPKSRHIAPC